MLPCYLFRLFTRHMTTHMYVKNAGTMQKPHNYNPNLSKKGFLCHFIRQDTPKHILQCYNHACTNFIHDLNELYLALCETNFV